MLSSLRHRRSAAIRRLGSGDGSASAGAGLGQQEGLDSKPRAVERDYDAGDPRRQTYHVVISSGAHAVQCRCDPTLQLMGRPVTISILVGPRWRWLAVCGECPDHANLEAELRHKAQSCGIRIIASVWSADYVVVPRRWVGV